MQIHPTITNYREARAHADVLDSAARAAGKLLDGFPKGPTGLTPDTVKASAEFKAAKAAFDAAFARQRAFNAWYVDAFKKDIAQDRAARRKGATSQSA